MNRSKARDFYSDYYEGTLAPGLRQTLDQAFASDPELKKDYEQFCSLMSNLDAMRDTEIEPASFLTERIEARLNQIDLERKSSQRPVFVRFWQPILIGAAASAAVLGVLVALKPAGNVDSDAAGIISPGKTQQQVKPPHLIIEEGTLKLSYQPRVPVMVTIKAGTSGTVLETVQLDSRTSIIPLGNSMEHGELLTMEFSNSLDPIRVVVPSQSSSPNLEGSGTLVEFAKALADAYQKPVQLGMDQLDRKIEWKIDQGDALDSLNDQLKRMQLTLESRKNGLIYLGS